MSVMRSAPFFPVHRRGAGGRGRRGSLVPEGRWAAVMLSPAMAVILLFVFVPIGLTFWISLHDWSMFTPLSEMSWRGLGNYRELVHDGEFHTALRNTVVYVALAVAIAVPLSLLLGMLLYFPRVGGRGIVRTALFATYVVPTVAIAIVWGALYAPGYGPFAHMFELVGLSPPQFLSAPSSALLSLVVFHVWQMLGYYVVLVVAGLTQIPGEVYEAARIDGASFLRQTIDLTLPLLKRTTIFVVMIAIINAVQIFDPIYILTQGGPAGSTNVLSFEIQRSAFQYGLAGHASAMAFTLLALLVAVAGILVTALRRV